MQVKFLVSVAGSDWSASPGEVVDISDKDAASYIKSGAAVPVTKTKKPTRTRETATRKKSEKAIRFTDE